VLPGEYEAQLFEELYLDRKKDMIITSGENVWSSEKVPRRFRFVEALPKSAMGKTLKAELRKRCRND